MTTALENKAMIVNLNTSFWGAAKSDAGLAATLIDQFKASEGAARVRKQLISQDALKPVRSAIQAAKQTHKRMTLAWKDNGERLLPVKVLDEYKDKMRDAIAKVDTARTEFGEKYDSLIAQARVDLGGMFDDDDYPASGTVVAKFGVAYEISPVPSASHFVADVGDDEAERIKAEIERQTQARLDAAMVGLYEQIEEALRHLIERLGFDEDGDPKRIHESTLEALQTIADSVPSLNLTNDRRLARMAGEIRKAIKKVGVDDLRYKSKKPKMVAEVTQRREGLATELQKVAEAYFGKAS